MPNDLPARYGLVWLDAKPGERARLAALGATLAAADPGDVAAMADACRGAACVVSAL